MHIHRIRQFISGELYLFAQHYFSDQPIHVFFFSFLLLNDVVKSFGINGEDPLVSKVSKVTGQLATCLTATGTHMPHGITQCFLPPGRSAIPPCNPAKLSWYSI